MCRRVLRPVEEILSEISALDEALKGLEADLIL